MKIKQIKSDGSTAGTSIILENGELLGSCKAISINLDATKSIKATVVLELYDIPFEICGPVEVLFAKVEPSITHQEMAPTQQIYEGKSEPAELSDDLLEKELHQQKGSPEILDPFTRPDRFIDDLGPGTSLNRMIVHALKDILTKHVRLDSIGFKSSKLVYLEKQITLDAVDRMAYADAVNYLKDLIEHTMKTYNVSLSNGWHGVHVFEDFIPAKNTQGIFIRVYLPSKGQ